MLLALLSLSVVLASPIQTQDLQKTPVNGNALGRGYDTNAHLNVRNAYNAGLKTKVFMSPQPLSSKSAASQMTEMLNGLTSNGVTVRSVWIQITSPITWNCGNFSSNINFISTLVNSALTALLEAPASSNAAITNAYAVDLSVYTTQNTFTCMKDSEYAAAFIRGYNPAGNGAYDTNAHLNVKNAWNAGIGTEVYMTPQPLSTKSAATQMTEMINGFTNNGVLLRSIWIQVTAPINWNCGSYPSNVNFLSSLITTARQNNLIVGIYTSPYDWQQITNNWTGTGTVSLWYWDVYGQGVNGESPANFNDFRSFGPFTQAAVKQYAQWESVCSTTVNRDVYPVSTTFFVNTEKMEGPVVGFIGL